MNNQQALKRQAAQPSAAFIEASAAWERGWSVFPCLADKKPDCRLLKATTGSPGWGQFSKRQCTFEELSSWSGAATFGCVTGPVSGVVVLDLDAGKPESLKGKHLPPTLIAKTQRGWHYFYNNPDGGLVTRSGLLRSVDVRGTGGYAILPGPPGRYWLDAGAVPADAPQWLREAAGRRQASTPRAPSTRRCKAAVIAAQTATEAVEIQGSIADALSQFYSSPEVALRLAPVLGIDVNRIGTAFCDVMPGLEPDRSPSASLYQNANGVVLYRSFRLPDQFYQLGEVRASLAYGEPTKLVKRTASGGIAGTTPEGVCWAIRLLIEGGIVKPAKVSHRPLQGDAPQAARKVYRGFLDLLAAKWLYTAGDPTPFSWRFASAWCGMGHRQAGDGMQWLLTHGYLAQTDKHKRTALFMPRPLEGGNLGKGSE